MALWRLGGSCCLIVAGGGAKNGPQVSDVAGREGGKWLWELGLQRLYGMCEGPSCADRWDGFAA